MGHKYVSTLMGGLMLGSGYTSADFHIWGQKLSLKLEFYMTQMGGAKLMACFYSNQFGMESGPTAFWVLIHGGDFFHVSH